VERRAHATDADTLEFEALMDGDKISVTVELGKFGDLTFEGTRA
jgi:hypothetical protein